MGISGDQGVGAALCVLGPPTPPGEGELAPRCRCKMPTKPEPSCVAGAWKAGSPFGKPSLLTCPTLSLQGTSSSPRSPPSALSLAPHGLRVAITRPPHGGARRSQERAAAPRLTTLWQDPGPHTRGRQTQKATQCAAPPQETSRTGEPGTGRGRGQQGLRAGTRGRGDGMFPRQAGGRAAQL